MPDPSLKGVLSTPLNPVYSPGPRDPRKPNFLSPKQTMQLEFRISRFGGIKHPVAMKRVAQARAQLEADKRKRAVFEQERRNASVRRQEGEQRYGSHLRSHKDAEALREQRLPGRVLAQRGKQEGLVKLGDGKGGGYRGSLALGDMIYGRESGDVSQEELHYNDYARETVVGKSKTRKPEYLRKLNGILQKAANDALDKRSSLFGLMGGTLHEGGFAKHVADKGLRGPNGGTISPILAAMWFRHSLDQQARAGFASEEERANIMKAAGSIDTKFDLNTRRLPGRNIPTPTKSAPYMFGFGPT